MRKLLQLFDKFALKIAVIATILFIPLYPKLPSIYITHTWVYVRLEDFLITLVFLIWFTQLLRKKVSIYIPLAIPIGLYWLVGGVSLLISIIFIGPHLANFFPKIAALEWLRRIEYMVLFFVGLSSVRSKKDVQDYCVTLCIALVGIVLYGIGQHFYINIWSLFPKFFEKYPFCFPSYQTGNEEFAKGVPLCLPFDARITSTFGGNYDLSAYMVVVIPLLISMLLSVKKNLTRIGLFLLTIGAITTLIFTSSRVSFAAYLIGSVIALIFLKKKKFIMPVFIISIILLLTFSSSLVNRFLQTVRFISVVTNSQGQVVGMTTGSLPSNLKNKISKNPLTVSAPPPSQSLPTGSSFITLPQTPVATSVAVVSHAISQKDAERLKLAYGGLEIATVSGSFLVQKALVYDISFTTRFQSEWPRDWKAFLSDPPLGTGYGSLTLASDNDYLRLLGETGFLGFISFIVIFIVFGIFLKETTQDADDTLLYAASLGLAGGVLGLACNAFMIDVFESSKVAETLWLLIGICAGGLLILHKRHIPYKVDLKKVFTSNTLIAIYLLIVILILFMGSINIFFVADDFTWLRWAAQSTFSSVPHYFTDAQGFFYRPLDKMIMLVLYTFGDFTPQVYHLYIIFLHFFMTLGVYFLVKKITREKLWAGIVALLFAISPFHGENLFWISSLSIDICSAFLIFSLLSYVSSSQKFRLFPYILSIGFGILALLSYEMAAILPILLFATDVFFGERAQWSKKLLRVTPFIILDIVYGIVREKAHVVAIGGDYSYNLSHMFPNIIGNSLGYLGLFLFGEQSLPWYNILRINGKTFSIHTGNVNLASSIIGMFLILGVAFVLYKNKKAIFSNSQLKLFIFGMVFFFIALLPFLGLGNLAERYGYLASVGFWISVISVCKIIAEKVQKRIIFSIGLVVLLLYSVWSFLALSNTMNQWGQAGKITYNTLGYFKIEQDQLPGDASVYFVNVPIHKANAWIFPAGSLADGIWFIYRYPDLHVYQYSSIAQAESQAQGVNDAYIFTFDNNGDISQVK